MNNQLDCIGEDKASGGAGWSWCLESKMNLIFEFEKLKLSALNVHRAGKNPSQHQLD